MPLRRFARQGETPLRRFARQGETPLRRFARQGRRMDHIRVAFAVLLAAWGLTVGLARREWAPKGHAQSAPGAKEGPPPAPRPLWLPPPPYQYAVVDLP